MRPRGAVAPTQAPLMPGTTARQGQMRFKPNVQLDPSQVIDMRDGYNHRGERIDFVNARNGPSTTYDAASLFGGVGPQQPDMQAWLQQLMALLSGGGQGGRRY